MRGMSSISVKFPTIRSTEVIADKRWVDAVCVSFDFEGIQTGITVVIRNDIRVDTLESISVEVGEQWFGGRRLWRRISRHSRARVAAPTIAGVGGALAWSGRSVRFFRASNEAIIEFDAGIAGTLSLNVRMSTLFKMDSRSIRETASGCRARFRFENLFPVDKT